MPPAPTRSSSTSPRADPSHTPHHFAGRRSLHARKRPTVLSGTRAAGPCRDTRTAPAERSQPPDAERRTGSAALPNRLAGVVIPTWLWRYRGGHTSLDCCPPRRPSRLRRRGSRRHRRRLRAVAKPHQRRAHRLSPDDVIRAATAAAPLPARRSSSASARPPPRTAARRSARLPTICPPAYSVISERRACSCHAPSSPPFPATRLPRRGGRSASRSTAAVIA